MPIRNNEHKNCKGRGHAPLPHYFWPPKTCSSMMYTYLQIILFRSCLGILHGCSSRTNDSILGPPHIAKQWTQSWSYKGQKWVSDIFLINVKSKSQVWRSFYARCRSKPASRSIFINISENKVRAFEASVLKCPQKKYTGLNIIIGIVQKWYEWSSCSFPKMILPWGDHFGKRTAW